MDIFEYARDIYLTHRGANYRIVRGQTPVIKPIDSIPEGATAHVVDSQEREPDFDELVDFECDALERMVEVIGPDTFLLFISGNVWRLCGHHETPHLTAFDASTLSGSDVEASRE